MDSSETTEALEGWNAFEDVGFPKILPPELASALAATLEQGRLEPLELQLRHSLLKCIQSDDEDASILCWRQSLRCCCHVAHHVDQSTSGYVDALSRVRKLPTVLLEDLFEASIYCESLWKRTVDADSSLLFGSLLWNHSSKACWLPFLKFANTLVQRLDSPSFILQTMAEIYPLGEKSASKAWGSHNTDTVTEWDEEEIFAVDVQPSTHMDYNLYQSFWQLQQDLGRPNGISVADFLKRLQTCLTTLESQPVRSSSSSPPDSGRYLTSSRILALQCQDANFRVPLLTQIVLVTAHLTSQVPVLQPQLAPYVQRATTLLEQGDPVHARVLSQILSTSELQWRQWKKNRGQPDLDAPAPKKPRKLPVLSTMRDEDGEGVVDYPLLSLTRDLSTTTTAIPSIEEHMEDYVEALDPEAGIEAEYHPKNQLLWSWRARRLWMKEHLPEFAEIRTDGEMENLVRTVYERKGQSIPGERLQELPQDEDEEADEVEMEVVEEAEESGGDEEEQEETEPTEEGEAPAESTAAADDEDEEMKDSEDDKALEASNDEDQPTETVSDGAELKEELDVPEATSGNEEADAGTEKPNGKDSKPEPPEPARIDTRPKSEDRPRRSPARQEDRPQVRAREDRPRGEDRSQRDRGRDNDRTRSRGPPRAPDNGYRDNDRGGAYRRGPDRRDMDRREPERREPERREPPREEWDRRRDDFRGPPADSRGDSRGRGGRRQLSRGGRR